MSSNEIIPYPAVPELLLRNLIDSCYDGMTITNPQGRMIWCNKAFLTMSGLTLPQIERYSVPELVEKGWLNRAAAIEALEQKKTVTIMVKYRTDIEALVTAAPMFSGDNELLYVITNVRDITELNKLKRELDNTTALKQSYLQTLQEVQLSNSDGSSIIYRSSSMEKIVALANKFAAVDTPILILGESGVGKDVLANYIHHVSERKGPFVKVNCGAIPEHLLESELFGYEAGAFTGASRQGKAGLFEIANKGTLFLDEIGDMPYHLQVKLLGVLQDMKIQKVGGTVYTPIDVRIIAATNSNLQEKIKEKSFREDLFYRINVLSLQIPPLRERAEDVFVLLMHFLKTFNGKHQMSRSFSPALLNVLLEYQWPGNIRELKNVVERLVITADDETIDASLLPPHIKSSRVESTVSIASDMLPVREGTLKEMVDDYEKQLLAHYISKVHPLKKCADRLGMDLTTLFRKKKRHGL